MQSDFEYYLSKHTTLPDDAINTISTLAIHKIFRKNETLLQAGEVCRYKAFIVKGLLRTYITGSNGNEPILLFSPENTWTLDAESYDNQIPSGVSIAAVEQTEVLLWRKDDFDRLLADVPQLKKFSEQLISRTMHQNRKRMMAALSATPEEKYEDFVRNFPGYLSRLPLHMIAAYLGISVKTLTRIRHTQLNR